MRSQASRALLVLCLTSAAVSAQDVNIPADFATIQLGIDNVGPGGTVFVDPGTYVEVLTVDPAGTWGTVHGQAAMSIVATGPGVLVDAPPLATRQAGYNPAITSTSGKQIDALLYVTGTTGIVVDGIDFDGNSDMDPSTGSVSSCAVSFRDAVGVVQNSVMQAVQQNPSSGIQGGFAAFVQGPLGGTSVTFSNCTFVDNQKGLIVATDLATCDVINCDLIGRGVTTSLAQNAIQYSAGAAGTVSGCAFDGFWWNGPSAFVGTGILGYDSGAPITVSNNTFVDCQVGFYQYGATTAVVDDTVTGNTFSQASFPVSANGYVPVGVIYADTAAGSQFLISGNSFNHLQDVGVALYDTGGTITDNYFNSNGSAFMNYNAQDESAGGNDWDGNTWSDFYTNPGYPTTYEVPGSAGAVDNAPSGDCPDHDHVNVATGVGPADVVLADLTGDGARDAATADSGGDTVTVLGNDGSGGFSTFVTVALTAGDAPESLDVGDLVSGGGADLAVAATGANAVRILSNDPVGTIAVSSSVSTASVGSRPISVAVGDLNGAGSDDVAVALEGELLTGGGAIAVILDGGAPIALDAPGGGFLRPQRVALCDLDADGDLDVVATMSGSLSAAVVNNVLLYENDGVGTGGFAAPVALSVSQNPKGVACGDLDGDGDDDLAITAELPFPFVVPGAVHVFLNGGPTPGAWSSGDFTLAGSYEGGTLPVDVAFGDLSDDSIPGYFSRADLFTANFGSTDVTRLNGFVPGTGSFGAAQSCSAGLNPAAVAIAHLSGDFTLDVVVANHDSNDVTIALAVPQALAQKFGAGCPGTAGLVPDISAVGTPTLGGGLFGVQVSNAKAFSPALLALSLGQVTVPLGGGCDLFLAPPLVLVQAFTGATGTATTFLTIPAPDTGFNGLNVYFQYAIFDPAGPYLGQFAFSDALRVKLGF